MRETWRWFGEYDLVGLDQVRQTGAAGIVSALHHIPYGEVWDSDTIGKRKAEIELNGLTWDVVESLPVHEDIKKGRDDLSGLFANYRQSLVNLAAQDVKTVCYNFMPILDWTRTELDYPVSGGGTCLRYSASKMAAFEIHMLGREQARDTYDTSAVSEGTKWYKASTQEDQDALLHAIMSGLPGAYDRYDTQTLLTAIQSYEGISSDDLRSNLARFLDEVVPTAAELGIRMCIHPDDPPRDILGLPRIVSNKDDIAWILNAHKDHSNGLTLCSGSLGSNPSNDVVDIAKSFSDRIHFAHLRNITKDPDGSFSESAHLMGDVDLVGVIGALLSEERARAVQIPYRADHGHALLDDIGKTYQPGYTLIGRLRGLAELRGIIMALSRKN